MAAAPDDARVTERAAPRPLFALWFVALTAALVAAQLLHLRRAPDIDLWLHLRIGDLLRGGTAFDGGPDPLVTLADRPYLPSQWLGQEAFSWIYEHFGLSGILVLRVLLITALVALVYLACRVVVGPVPAAVSALLAMMATAAAWGERPQLIGLVLEAAVALVWMVARARGRTPWLAIPITWLWACMHGSWVLGVATNLVGTLAILLDSSRRARLRALLLVDLLALAAVATTPLGPGLLVQPFAVNELARQTVNEWQAPAPSNPLFILVLMMAAGVMLRGLRSLRPALPDLLTGAAGATLAMYSVRTVAFGAVLLAPAFAAAVDSRREAGPSSLRKSELWPWLAAALALAVLPGAIVGVDREGPLGPATSSALHDLRPGSHVAVDVRVSGWILHEFPDLRPLRDLRAEVYSPTAAAGFESLMTAEPLWRDVARKDKVAAVLADSGGPLVQELRAQPDWVEVADEKGYALWMPVREADR